jgi:hypothetical protein
MARTHHYDVTARGDCVEFYGVISHRPARHFRWWFKSSASFGFGAASWWTPATFPYNIARRSEELLTIGYVIDPLRTR